MVQISWDIDPCSHSHKTLGLSLPFKGIDFCLKGALDCDLFPTGCINQLHWLGNNVTPGYQAQITSSQYQGAVPVKSEEAREQRQIETEEHLYIFFLW